MAPALTEKTKAIIALLLASAIWGVAGPVIKITLNEIPPYTFLFVRCLMATLMFIPILFFAQDENHHKINWDDLPHLFLLGFLGITVNLALVFEAYNRTSSLEGTVIGSLGPIFIILAGVILLKDTISKNEKIGLSISLIGGFLFILDPIITNGGIKFTNLLGNFLMFLSLIEWTIYVIYSKKVLDKRRHYSPLTITVFLFLTGLITFAPLSFVEYLKDPMVYQKALELPAILGVFYMALFSSIIAYYAYEYALEKVEASETAIYSYLNPIFAAPISIFILKEYISTTFIIASVFIILGTVVMNVKKRIKMQE